MKNIYYNKNKIFFYHIILILLMTPVLWNCNNRSTTNNNNDDFQQNDPPPRSSSGSLRTVDVSSAKYSRFKKGDFSKDDCEEDSDCRQLCRDMRFDSDVCEDFPQDMVEVLFDNFEYLREARSRINQLNPAALGTFLHEDQDVILRVLRGSWSNVDILEFLKWIAQTPQAVKALEVEDDENKLLINVLRELDSDVKTALLTPIGQYSGDTFISEAIKIKNDEAITLVLSLITNTDEKGVFFCKRQEVESRGLSNSSSCHYSSDRRRQKYCYKHGPTIWSYINSLTTDEVGELPDKLKSDSGRIEITEDTCESFCGDHGNSCAF